MKRPKMKSHITKFALILLLLIGDLTVRAQNEYTLFKTFESFAPDSTGKFHLALDNLNFFKNNEFKSDLVKGYTLTGTLIRPKAVYYPDKKLRMEIGGQLLKYTGRDEYDNIDPWFNIVYKPTEKISILMGNINSDQNHKLPEFLYDPERFYTANPEAGLQLLYQSNRLTADFWIDWQKMILKGDPYKEQFAFGSNLNFILKNKDNSRLSLPLTFYGMHRGGEIDTDPDEAKSFLSVTSGITFQKLVNGHFIRQWDLNCLASITTYPNENQYLIASTGYGFYASGTLSTNVGRISASYWHGQKYYTPQGSIIYQSYSEPEDIWVKNSGLINLKYYYERQIMEDTHLGFMLDYYYDTINGKMMNIEGLYLIVNLEVITKKKQ